jgi:ComF family protein
MTGGRTLRDGLARTARVSWRALSSFVFPDECLNCGSPLGAHERHLCASCRASLRPELTSATFAGTGGAWTAFFIFPFDGPVGPMIRALKYGCRRSIALELVHAALPAARALLEPPPDSLEPVPLSRLRRRERGFNQCELMARIIAEEGGLPVSLYLRRIRHTDPQADLPRRLRLLNPRGAFAAQREACRGRRILLLDDVVTTGATMAAARRALLDAGASEVVCLAAAGSEERPPESG